jgi:integrase
VHQQLVRTKSNGLCVTAPKTAKGRRSVRLASRAVQALEDHRRRQLEQEQGLSETWKEADLVFTLTVGTPLDPSNLTYHTFQPFLRRAGLLR